MEEASSRLFQALKRTAAEEDPSAQYRNNIKWKDLYLYFQKHVEGGASTKSIDRLFKACDLNNDGIVTEREFRKVRRA